MNQISKEAKTVASMFSSIANVYDRLNRGLSLWQDVGWRNELINGADIPADGVILDICTGTGDLALGFLTQRADFKGFVYGIDFSAYMIDKAREKLAKLGAPWPSRIDFLMGNALDLQFMDDKFDVVSAAFGIRNFENTRLGMEEMHRVLKPDGQLNILEFFSGGITSAPVRYYTDHIVPWIGDMVSRTRAYTYLRSTSNQFFSISEFEALLASAGFKNIRFERMTFGIAHIVRCVKG